MQQEPRVDGGAPGVHSGEQQDSTAKLAQPQRLDPIDLFCPGDDDDRKSRRRRVSRAHGAADTRAKQTEHSRARAIYWIAAQLAADWTFQRASRDELDDVLATLSRLFLAAGTVERLEAPDGR